MMGLYEKVTIISIIFPSFHVLILTSFFFLQLSTSKCIADNFFASQNE